MYIKGTGKECMGGMVNPCYQHFAVYLEGESKAGLLSNHSEEQSEVSYYSERVNI